MPFISHAPSPSQTIPENMFVVAACNPHRGNSLASHKTWVRGTYFVRSLHPTLKFLMWDYGSLDEHQERDYINAKMKMMNKTMKNPEVRTMYNTKRLLHSSVDSSNGR